MKSLPFSVDAALLRELGERLVGRPEIALSELIKNAYDADATQVEVTFDSDSISISDNGTGMTFAEFKDFWMRVGSPHKASLVATPKLGRPITGSKGVGRLAAQFLADEVELRTSPEAAPDQELFAYVDWSKAVTAGNLQQARASYEERRPTSGHAAGSRYGTEVELRGLRHEWNAEAFRRLAQQIWNLQPPFGGDAASFEVRLVDPAAPEAVEAFDDQMSAILNLWDARLHGRLEEEDGKARIHLLLEYRDGERRSVRYALSGLSVHQLEFEIRVFDLRNRQPYGIRVEDARQYLAEFGGVHVYDAGFRLPYYGSDTDWLRIETDHSHRLSRSQLLPEDLQRPGGLTFLPTNTRLFGSVRVNTGAERRAAMAEGRQDYLALQVSRDRLLDNESFRGLRDAVRWAVDYYAVTEAERSASERARSTKIRAFGTATETVLDTVRAHRPDMSKEAYGDISQSVRDLVVAVERAPERIRTNAAMLGALATAGASALAYEHEISKQLSTMEAISEDIDRIVQNQGPIGSLEGVGREIRGWVETARGTRDLFAYLRREDHRQAATRMPARATIDQVARNARVLLRGLAISSDEVDSALVLPPGSLAEWTAVFQNVLANAAAATRKSADKRVSISSRSSGSTKRIWVSDTGVGVDLSDSDRLFEPFERRARVSTRDRTTGLAGTGLGLTIVRLVAGDLGTEVRFVKPEAGFATTFELSWVERGGQ